MADLQSGATEEWLSPSAALSRLHLDEHELGNEARANLAASTHVQQRHGVSIGPFSILLPPNAVSEVVKGSTVFPVPKTASWIKGLLNLRGNLVPVFNLAEHFDESYQAPKSPQLIAVGKADQAVALIVDGIPRLASTERPISHSTLPLPEALRNHVRGAYIEEENMWLELDVSGLIESLTDQMEG
jgi:chemotaxis signal transduction protein